MEPIGSRQYRGPGFAVGPYKLMNIKHMNMVCLRECACIKFLHCAQNKSKDYYATDMESVDTSSCTCACSLPLNIRIKVCLWTWYEESDSPYLAYVHVYVCRSKTCTCVVILNQVHPRMYMHTYIDMYVRVPFGWKVCIY